MTKKKPFSLHIDADDHEALRAMSSLTGRSMSELAGTAISKEIDAYARSAELGVEIHKLKEARRLIDRWIGSRRSPSETPT